jgi:acetyl esterase
LAATACLAAVATWTGPISAEEPMTQQPTSRPAEATLKVVQYKTVGEVKLNMHVVAVGEGQRRPAIVFFFCGGWNGFDARKYYPQSEYFASRGAVCFNAEVRVMEKHKTTPAECFTDAKSAIRWVRQHAAEYGVDPKKVVASGGSAAGHVSACLSTVDGFDDPTDDLKISAKPDAVVAFCPVLIVYDNERRVGIFGGELRARELSPLLHVKPGAAPTLLLHGKADERVVPEESQKYQKAMQAAGNRCDLVLYDRAAHGFHTWFDGKGKFFKPTVRAMDEFLTSLGFLAGEPTIDGFKYAPLKAGV